MQQITIDYKNFLAGISRMDGVEDGGYSPLYGGHNIQEERNGYLYPQHAYSMTEWGGSASAIMDGNTTQYPVIYVKNQLFRGFSTSEVGIMVSDDGSVYTHNSINRFNDEFGLSAANIVFSKYGHESGVFFQDDIYIMAEDDIAQITFDANGSANGVDSDWWTNVRSHGSIPGEKTSSVVIEDTTYFIVQNKIHTWDGSSSVENALTLPPDFYATAAIKHPNGRDLIVFGSAKEVDDDVAGVGFRAYYINTVDLEFTDEIPIDREVHGVWNVGGAIYTTCGEWVCIFDGNGLQPIYKLDLNLADSPASDLRQNLIRTQHATVTDQGYLLIPDGTKVLAIGNLGQGVVMWHIADLTDDMTRIHTLFNIGNKYVGIWGYNGTDFTPADLEATILEIDDHDGTGKWASNKYRFNQKAWVRRIEIDHETLESGDDFRVGHIKEDGTEQELRAITYTKYGAKNQTRVDCNIYTDVYQLYLEWVAGGVGIKKITIWYEDGE